MGKVKRQEELQKPKFQQTKLCFSSFSPTNINKEKKATEECTKKLERSIQELNISTSGSSHADPCKNCSCTALKPNSNEVCDLSYCTKCILEKVNETAEWISKNEQDTFVYKNGNTIQHVKTKAKWACLVCRGLCDCKTCLGSKRMLSFNIKTTKKAMIDINPPELTEINLLYSEQEIWTRLQIREFIFRFGEIYGFENRLLTSLQNVQGDWRIKKFGAYIVWQFLIILNNTTNYELTLEETEDSIPQLAKNILNGWISDKKLDNLYFDKEGKHLALLQALNTEGMTGRRWQDIAELLAVAQVNDIPVPTSRDITSKDIDKMDIDDDDDNDEQSRLDATIKRYQKSTNRNLLSIEDELKMINMLLELLLYDTQIRQSLVAAGQKAMTKELRDLELDFKKYQKDWKRENLANLMNRTNLSNRLHQLQATKGKDQELKQVQIELDALETLIRDQDQDLSKKQLELYIYTQKQEKRLKSLGSDMLGNEYWLFNDILDHLNNATDYRNNEPYWAYGIIIIGPGFKKDERRKWWFVKGNEDIKLLKDWITNESKKHTENADLKRISTGIEERIKYLVSLENVVYGEGFFQ
ncbi:hypothetical protein HPULCUR_010584 [Helicostylum pulchrum]|uniref:Uncharacterized protein n=1 Tax=Helicostylum pulchrum TaxID=562976 RepID=A0ABP9YDS6_9FUNG